MWCSLLGTSLAVRCPEIRGVRYSGVVNVQYIWEMQLVHSTASAIRHTSAIGGVR